MWEMRSSKQHSYNSRIMHKHPSIRKCLYLWTTGSNLKIFIFHLKFVLSRAWSSYACTNRAANVGGFVGSHPRRYNWLGRPFTAHGFHTQVAFHPGCSEGFLQRGTCKQEVAICAHKWGKDSVETFGCSWVCALFAGDFSCGRCHNGTSPSPELCTDIPPHGSPYTCVEQVQSHWRASALEDSGRTLLNVKVYTLVTPWSRCFKITPRSVEMHGTQQLSTGFLHGFCCTAWFGWRKP